MLTQHSRYHHPVPYHVLFPAFYLINNQSGAYQVRAGASEKMMSSSSNPFTFTLRPDRVDIPVIP
jgi:hypothetical protein